jgi:hypothetical protein
MPFLGNIVDKINTTLKASSLNKEKLQPSLLHGISTIVGREKVTGSVEFLPAIFQDGKAKLLTPDDKYSVIIYHKLVSKVYGVSKSGYGDGNNYTETAEMAMVVYLNANRAKIVAEQLEPMLIAGLPVGLPPNDLQSIGLGGCVIHPASSDLDQLRVFRQEYQQSEYFLKPSDQLFLIRYKIVSTFDRRCLNTCLCG